MDSFKFQITFFQNGRRFTDTRYVSGTTRIQALASLAIDLANQGVDAVEIKVVMNAAAY